MPVRIESLIPDPDRRPGAPVESDRKCKGCGYNLRGLSSDGRCPECGLPVRLPRDVDAPLSEMPVPVIRRFQIGSWMATAAVASLIAVVVASRMAPLPPALTPAILLALAALWMASVWLLTPALRLPQGITHGFAQGGPLRSSARVLQLGWVAAAGAALMRVALPASAQGGPVPDLLATVAGAGLVAGMIGLVVTAILLHRLAEWARDGTAAGAFNLAMWGVPVSTVMLMLTGSILLVALAFIMLWIVSVGAFPYALFSLSRSLGWSVHHSRDHSARLERRRRRAERYASQVSSTVVRMDEAAEARKRGTR